VVSVLTIAGSDPSGCAGIEADLEMIARAGVAARTAITALTVQGVTSGQAVYATPRDVLRDILKQHSQNLPSVVKIGMIATRDNLEVICDFLERYPKLPVVLDPVLRATSGLQLLEMSAIPLLKERLLPRATIVTPNLDEVEMLLGKRPATVSEMETAARELQRGTQVMMVKGGHLQGDPVDVIWDGTQMNHLSSPRIGTTSPRGTGCRLASGIAAQMALGKSAIQACAEGKQMLLQWIRY